MSSQSNTVLIKAGRVYNDDDPSDRPTRADILIVGDRIEAVQPNLAEQLTGPDGLSFSGRPLDCVIDASDRLVLPGMVNAHYHSHDTLLKGCFETIPRETWLLNALPPNYSRRSPAEIRARTLLGAVECLRAGITTVQDMLTLAPIDAEDVETVLQAYEDAGLRCVFALQTGDVHGAKVTPFWEEIFPDAVASGLSGVVANNTGAAALAGAQRALHDRFARRSTTLSWGLAPSSPERCSPDYLRALAELAADLDLPIFTHIYESRATTLIARQKFAPWNGSLVSYLSEHGLLSPRTSLAHGVWMRPEEIEAVAESGASVVLNPVSNLKTRSGVAPIGQYMAAGINLGLGCDNDSCSDAQNLFQAMKAMAGLAAVSSVEDEQPTARDALLAATAGGARALGLDKSIGRIRPGLKADLTLLRLDDPAFIPFNSAARQTVFSECGRAVDTVFVNGRILVRDGRCTTVDEARLRDEVEDAMAALREEIAAVSARTEALKPQLQEAHRRTWAAPLEIDRYIGGASAAAPGFTNKPTR